MFQYSCTLPVFRDYILEFAGRFCFLSATAKSPTVVWENNPTASINWLNKSSEIGTVSSRSIGQCDLGAALIRDMECEQHSSLRANKICTPPAAGILILPLCRFNYCGIAVVFLSSATRRTEIPTQHNSRAATENKLPARLC